MTHARSRTRRSTSPPRSCCGCAPTSPARPAWTTGRARTPRSSRPPRASRSTGRSTSPSTTRAVAGDPRRRDRDPRRPQDRRGRRGHVRVGARRRCWAASRPGWRTRTRSTSSGAPCSTPGRRTRPAGTTSPARREDRGPRPGLPPATRRRRRRRVPEVRHDELVPALAEHRRADGAAHPDVPALEREALGHPERRPRQPRPTSGSTPR